ncbi:hypothetical protein CEUSTIGMA_g7931.t1 [Chlamydomonas eustigma]|uniref:ADP-ribosylglycohydrolase n=1 Tax=Chlamydomonas eustigma TaxID=1157962 RepID=A0A250XBM3_9CHLO|nr:hypothetical protein CEUSTIGMA_g7931.t1 [Chlamydomonas eustigma]|eukprot:GAX80493.1 hypothetical protein CEUSTIGMA_g7931.t1 [Chlamydomonas eustigma]
MPLHWIYDIQKINDLLKAEGRENAPEFFPTPSCSFYQASFGDQSPYGAELVPLLRTLASSTGDFSADSYAKEIVDYFTSSTAYRNASIRGVITNYEEGKRGIACGHATDFQANCFAKAALIVAKYGGKPELLNVAEKAIRVQQNNDDAVRYGLTAVKLMEKVVVEGHTIDQALMWLSCEGSLDEEMKALVKRGIGAKVAPLKELQFEPAEYMKEMMTKASALSDSLPPFTWSVWCNGPACGNPAAFVNVVMAGAVYENSYVDGVRANLMAGGDNCSRGCMVGALLAAQGGLDSIPVEWRKQTKGYAEYEALVDKMLA